ncbi:MAG: hypothetical protein H8J66_14775 [Nitrospira sp.]|nr:hypothetical protein [Nitrospira sp.]
MDKRRRIYLAWPSDRFVEALHLAVEVIRAGHDPLMQTSSAEWSRLDRNRVEACDCLVRFPGENPKADCAVDCAKVLGLPVYFSLQECLDDLPKRVTA